MSRTRRLLLFALPAGSVVAVLALAAWLVLPRPSAITRGNAAKIQEGMTLAEVEAILGGPARDESTGPTEIDIRALDGAERLLVRMAVADRMLEVAASGSVRRWTSDRVTVHVRFDEAARVSIAEAFPLCRTDESLLDRLRRWLGL
jgi:hypothetical protein